MLGMRRGELDRLVAAAAAQIGMHHVALDRAGPHDRHLDDEVVEAARLQPRQHVHLRPALDLEHADRIGAAQHVVDGRIVARHGAERELAGRDAASAGRSALRMQVSMPRPSTSTLSRPSASISSLSHSMKVRSSMAALPIGTTSDSGPRVSTKPPTCWERWRGKPISSCVSSSTRASSGSAGSSPASRTCSSGRRGIAQAPDGAGERGDGILGQAQRLADLAHRRAAAIGDDGGGEAGAVAAVAGVDILDHLLAPLVLEIDVDVGRLLALRRDEALEQQIDLGRIDVGDAEAVADGGVGGRAAPLAEDAVAARVMHDVVHGEEIGRVVELGDQRELLAAACRAPCRARRRESARRRPPRSSSSRCDCGVLPGGTGSSGYS